MKRQATAVWKGNGKEGKGHLSTQSGTLKDTQYSYKSRFEEGAGTNPEELIAAAHAGCFAMKLTFNLQQAGYTAKELRATSTVSLEDGAITRSDIRLQAQVDGIGQEAFDELVKDAEKNCPISAVLKAKITVEYTLNA